MNFREEIQEEAIQVALKNNYGAIQIPMRGGKTLVGLRIIENFKKVLVSYPNKSIFNSWKEDSDKFDISIDHVDFTTHVSLSKKDLKSYDCVMLDEIHAVSVANWEFISENIPVRMYGLSGTMPDKGEKLDYMNTYCPIIYKKTLDDTTGKTNKDYKITVHLLEPSSEKNIALKSGKFWSEKAKIRFFENKYNLTRNFNEMLFLIRAIQDSVTKLEYMKKLSNKIDRGLFFVETSKQCDLMGFPSYHSKESKSEQNLIDFKTEKINKLVTINQLQAGVTIHNLNDVVILHCYSSNNKAAQKLARALNYAEDQIANIHIICLKGTRDEQWTRSGLKDFDPKKIEFIEIKTQK